MEPAPNDNLIGDIALYSTGTWSLLGENNDSGIDFSRLKYPRPDGDLDAGEYHLVVAGFDTSWDPDNYHNMLNPDSSHKFGLSGGRYLMNIKNFAPVPEPGTILHISVGLLGIAGIRRKKK